MSGTVKIKYYIETSNVGSRCSDVIEFDRDEWNAMTEQKREAEMREHAFNDLSWGWDEVECDEEEE